ncbi:MAG: hypothetical protein BAJALOKI2v1_230054 [Promethearchaeota archaeon]|nr:MAG: hypothetical protein BAJALOKI2v1_230054 [Candidatus Lokiarchaeota archaeon]
MNSTQVLDDTISAMISSLENYNFSLFNILSNRLITDSVFLNNKIYCIFGIFMRELSQSISLIELSKELNKQATDELLTFIEKFLEKRDKKSEEYFYDFLWKEYSILYNNIMIFSIAEEEENYSHDKDYTNYAIDYILKFLYTELENFFLKKRPILLGVLSEIDRLFKNFGFEYKHLIIKTIISFFNRTIDYKLYEYGDKDQDLRDINEFNNYLTQFLDIILRYLEDADKVVKKSHEYLFEYAKEWRLLYIKYLHTIPQYIQVRRPKNEQMLIPEDAKEQLKNLVSKSLLKDEKVEEK